jgi:hypothetical protein
MIVLRGSRRDGRGIWGLAALLCVSQLVSTARTATAAERRGGIEIGSKGVKMTVVELAEKPGGPAKVLQSAIVNTTISAGVVKTGRYSPDAIHETAEAAGVFARRLRGEFGLGSDRIRVVGSSGLPSASNRQELIDAVSQATGLPPMEIISTCREVELTIAGLVPRADWPNAALIDIGSGNTKGGYFRPDGKGVFLSVPLGSVTFVDRVTKDGKGKPFAEAAEQLRPSLIEAPLAEQVRANPALTERRIVFLSGGAPYAMTTLMRPQDILHERVQLTTKDIGDYVQHLRSSPRVPSPDFAAIADPKVRSAAEKEFGKVRDNFTRENLIAGAEILAGLSTALQLEGKTLVFDRNGATAWLHALLDPSLTPPPTSDVEATEVSRPAPVTRVAERTPGVEEAKAAELPPPAARATAPARAEPGRVYPSPQSAPAPQ